MTIGVIAIVCGQVPGKHSTVDDVVKRLGNAVVLPRTAACKLESASVVYMPKDSQGLGRVICRLTFRFNGKLVDIVQAKAHSSKEDPGLVSDWMAQGYFPIRDKGTAQVDYAKLGGIIFAIATMRGGEDLQRLRSLVRLRK